ncbi:MAG TPA: aminotransferase class I/II-fold pyridoxal phosphate-dependent enzyme, partial [Pseudonocardia sp.]|nr:aminotransferase class I/II-fold pyridoxal phosphate-dependent enzyme [Pseudonocardia sp.]
VIIHPQFTEPEAALIAAGHRPERVILEARTGFRLDPALIPADADLIMIGNPTNPTSALHPAALLRTLVRPGRLLVVDEAFMDAVPGEPETMISPDLRGVLVLRSLTKTWGLAGLRAGYAVGDAEVIAAMAVQQPPWSVSTPALAAIAACLSDQARHLAAVAAEEITRHRGVLVAGLESIGLAAVGQPMAPFVLVDTGPIRGDQVGGWVRTALRDEGFAVRRGETFPGLGPDWIRIAVRDPSTSDRLVRALHRLTNACPAMIVDDGRRGR